MLNSLKQAGKDIGREINGAWESLSEGWRELLSRSSDAITPFVRHRDEGLDEGRTLATLPRNVNIDKAEARYKNGVLTVRLPKEGGGQAKSIAVS